MDIKLRNKHIKKLRGNKLWSQDELASASNLSLRTIQRMEKGGKASTETVKALASALGVSTSELIATEGFVQYQHTQIGWTVLFLLLIPIPFLLSAPIFCALLVSIAILVGTLTIEVNKELISWRFGIGLIRKRLKISEVKECEITKTPWYAGYGMRYHLIKGYWLYNVSGPDAVEITLASGKKMRLGTDEPQFLYQAIKSVLLNRY